VVCKELAWSNRPIHECLQGIHALRLVCVEKVAMRLLVMGYTTLFLHLRDITQVI
jgi:hypothetical protein